MKASILLAVSGAAIAMAGPVEKRAYQTEVVTNIVYVTVTEDPDAPATKKIFNAGKHKYYSHTTTLAPISIIPVNTQAPSPPPSPPPPPPAETPAPAPAPEVPAAVPEAPAPAPAPEQPAYVPETQPAAPAADLPAPGDDFASTAAYHHNIHRLNHSAPAVTFSQEYASYAAITAKTCKFAHDTATGGGGYGQNIAMYAATGDVQGIGASKIVAQAITDMWYNSELPLFPGFGSSPDMGTFEGWGHFSQVVWKGTEQVGCDSHLCPAGTMFPNMDAWFTVCNYAPAGNVGGGYINNVLAPLNKATVTA